METSYMDNKLLDKYGRIAKKLRISVTDRCNMRCIYCMPTNNVKWLNDTEILSFTEIVRLTRILVKLGIEKIRITGGEPLVRPGLQNLIGSISMITGIKRIDLSTNGLLLQDKVDQLSSSGLVGVNISLDSFKEDKFKMMSGVSGVDKVINSIHDASEAGLNVKINTVIIRGWNDDEIVDFAMFARESGLTVRFIEFMPLDGSGIWKPDLVFSKREMIQRINMKVGEIVPMNNESSEPARLFSFSDGTGSIGFIPSITEPFCSQCDRIRITSDGRFLTCLFENPGYDLKTLLRNEVSDQVISRFILESLNKKPEGIIRLIRNNDLRPKLNLMHTIGG
ncbi:MAG: GTP 3',8-cyclase MoaA [Thaumarchaeota archaeon]|nr:MAG: GTP 3',8-cyclase MoaA [Nitrososphaerota archaeon]